MEAGSAAVVGVNGTELKEAFYCQFEEHNFLMEKDVSTVQYLEVELRVG